VGGYSKNGKKNWHFFLFLSSVNLSNFAIKKFDGLELQCLIRSYRLKMQLISKVSPLVIRGLLMGVSLKSPFLMMQEETNPTTKNISIKKKACFVVMLNFKLVFYIIYNLDQHKFGKSEIRQKRFNYIS
jgi:hypothetical protein